MNAVKFGITRRWLNYVKTNFQWNSFVVALLFFLAVPEDDEENREADASAGRFVRYQFTPAFLKLRTVGAT